jgi:hypothetical protein
MPPILSKAEWTFSSGALAAPIRFALLHSTLDFFLLGSCVTQLTLRTVPKSPTARDQNFRDLLVRDLVYDGRAWPPYGLAERIM